MISLRARQVLRLWTAFVGLGLFVCLLAWSIFNTTMGSQAPDGKLWSQLPVRLVPEDTTGQMVGLSPGDTTLLLGGAHATEVRSEMRFFLPEPEAANAQHWVVWIRRAPLERVRLSRSDGWVSEERSFLSPAADEGVLPTAYVFRLPTDWRGEVVLTLETKALRVTALQPQVIPEALATYRIQRSTVVSTTAYASLLMLGLLALALFFASHDWSFLTYFGGVSAIALLLGSYNGHIYIIDPVGLFGFFGAGWLQAVVLVFEASALRVLLEYAQLEEHDQDMADNLNVGIIGLWMLSAVCLFWGSDIERLMSWFQPMVWATGVLAAMMILVKAWRRRVPYVRAITITSLLALLSLAYHELIARGVVQPNGLNHLISQLTMMLAALLVGVGLIGRISKYREQRDREQRARADSERRMYREAVRSELMSALQLGLRGADQDELQPAAFKLLLEHLRRVVPSTSAVAITRGYQGQDVLVSHPSTLAEDLQQTAGQRLHALRQQLGTAVELQRPVTKPGENVPVAIEALIALPLRSPAWGIVVLERIGTTVFHPEELNIVRELARLTVMQTDEAMTALQLRRTAEVDALTGLLNRRSLDQALTRNTQAAHRVKQPLSMLFVDIDHFKTVNDRLGHGCGDHCLRELARVLRDKLGEEDTFGRYGGEEFLVILPGRTIEAARGVAELIRLAVADNEIRWQNYAFRLTVSIGVASQHHDETQPAPVLERADKALYAAKRAGRNRVHVAPAEFRPTSMSV